MTGGASRLSADLWGRRPTPPPVPALSRRECAGARWSCCAPRRASRSPGSCSARRRRVVGRLELSVRSCRLACQTPLPLSTTRAATRRRRRRLSCPSAAPPPSSGPGAAQETQAAARLSSAAWASRARRRTTAATASATTTTAPAAPSWRACRAASARCELPATLRRREAAQRVGQPGARLARWAPLSALRTPGRRRGPCRWAPGGGVGAARRGEHSGPRAAAAHATRRAPAARRDARPPAGGPPPTAAAREKAPQSPQRGVQ